MDLEKAPLPFLLPPGLPFPLALLPPPPPPTLPVLLAASPYESKLDRRPNNFVLNPEEAVRLPAPAWDGQPGRCWCCEASGPAPKELPDFRLPFHLLVILSAVVVVVVPLASEAGVVVAMEYARDTGGDGPRVLLEPRIGPEAPSLTRLVDDMSPPPPLLSASKLEDRRHRRLFPGATTLTLRLRWSAAETSGDAADEKSPPRPLLRPPLLLVGSSKRLHPSLPAPWFSPLPLPRTFSLSARATDPR